MTKEAREYTAEHRQRRLDQGLCVRCGENPHRANRQTCVGCWHKQRDEEKSRRTELAKQGLCTNCGSAPASEGHRTCDGCRPVLNDRSGKYRKTEQGQAWGAAYARKIRHGLRAAGLCGKCGRSSPDAYLCGVCNAAAKERRDRWKAKRREVAKEQNLCGNCLSRPRDSDRYYCTECLDRVAVSRFRKFGLTLELLRAFGKNCHICGSEVGSSKHDLAVDHNHTTGKIRGLLCKGCNNGLGMFRDRPDLLRRAADYVESDGFHHIST